jgi:hypothetical protein
MEGPVFVVVGHTNWGKSSVVATLAADERLAVSRRPGTTQYNQLLPWQMGERTLCTFIDTPGFDAPRHVLRWLKERDRSAVERPSLVQRFVEEHEGSEQFRHECELMRPILAGGIILYVVDTSVPPDAVAEAELQILQWTGRPRMALLNRTRQRDCEEQWRALLSQRFQLIRPFDAHQADFATRLQLLHALRELDPASRCSTDRARPFRTNVASSITPPLPASPTCLPGWPAIAARLRCSAISPFNSSAKRSPRRIATICVRWSVAAAKAC